jgi:DNA-directed RNA polymerase sigma subunit (sigma70/sigma32)
MTQEERNREILARYSAGGTTFEALGDEYGLTKERVRQLVRQLGDPKKDRVGRPIPMNDC